MSSLATRTSARAPGPSSSVTRAESPRTSATGSCRALLLTRSPAAAISSATAAMVTSRVLPNASCSPRWSRTGSTPAAPIAVSVWPARHGRPMVSVTTTPTVTPSRPRSALRSRRADSSGSSGSSTTVPGAVLDSSTPAAAITSPCLVSEIVVAPRLATTRTVSAAIASSRDIAVTRPSALLTILDVTTRMSPSSSPGPPAASAASAIIFARSSPEATSGIPGSPEMAICGVIGPALRPGRWRPWRWPPSTGRRACTAGARAPRCRPPPGRRPPPCPGRRPAIRR